MSRFAPITAVLLVLAVEFAYADGIGSLAALDGIVPFLLLIVGFFGFVFLFVFGIWINISWAYIKKTRPRMHLMNAYLLLTFLLLAMSAFAAYMMGVYESIRPNYFYFVPCILIAALSFISIHIQAKDKGNERNDA